MKKSYIVVLIIAVSVGILYAGYHFTRVTEVVKYSTGGGYAYGVLSHTRNSSDRIQYIGCSLRAYSGSSAISTYCQAKDAAGEYVYGYSTESKYHEVVDSINEDAYVYFVVDSSGKITYLYINNSSYYLP